MCRIKIASLQLKVLEDKYDNIEKLAEMIAYGAAEDADIISLPEMWNCPYETKRFPGYAEPEKGDSWLALSTIARKNAKYIVGGSIPELGDDGRVYNTCYVFGRDGSQIGKHRKVHLFDIYAHGEQVFKESDTLTGGASFDTFETEWCRMAVNICFDIRFPESSRIPALKGAKVIFNPASFNMTTGPAHWELAFRQRAVENQVFMVGTAAARDPDASYTGYGHSIITDPWGRVLMQMDEKEGVCITEIDPAYADEVREKLPLIPARRTDVYDLCYNCHTDQEV
ncbi:MAG: carbon-nitrogen hydrolase family protein [Mogibacterium sp.]|nr:carbon-nitrogen hydrolase family protein [Mogibacterium sp.]